MFTDCLCCGSSGFSSEPEKIAAAARDVTAIAAAAKNFLIVRFVFSDLISSSSRNALGISLNRSLFILSDLNFWFCIFYLIFHRNGGVK